MGDKIDRNCALIIYKMFLEQSKCELHREIKMVAHMRAQLKCQSPFYTDSLRHTNILLARTKGKLDAQLVTELLRYIVSNCHLFTDDKGAYELFYLVIILKIFEFISNGMDSDVLTYFMARIPRTILI